MKKANRRDRQPQAGKAQVSVRRVPVWLPGAILLVVLAGIAVGVWAMNRPRAGGASAGAAPAPTSSSAIPAEVRQGLVGRWLRRDGGYVLAIEDVGEDGKVAATYANPRPINVAKARATQEGGNASIYVELRDRGYPGNSYMLTYDRAQDQLAGTYHHLGIGQTFDVRFERVRKEVSEGEQTGPATGALRN